MRKVFSAGPQEVVALGFFSSPEWPFPLSSYFFFKSLSHVALTTLLGPVINQCHAKAAGGSGKCLFLLPASALLLLSVILGEISHEPTLGI